MTISKLDYFKQLSNHDWTYVYSDCLAIYNKGHNERKIIVANSKISQDHKAMYSSFIDMLQGVRDSKPTLDEFKSYMDGLDSE